MLAGFAGGAADAFTLFEYFEAQAHEARQSHARGHRAREGLAHGSHAAPARGAPDRRRRENSLLISGTGDVIEPEHDLLAIGSGGAYAQAAAQALYENTQLDARAIVEKALTIAGTICIYTNTSITVEEL